MSAATPTAGAPTAAAQTLTFTAPMPGLEALTEFTLRTVAEAPGLFVLEGNGAFEARLFMADAALFVPGYEPSLPAAALAGLDLADVRAALVLVVVNPSEAETTVNLLAPLVLNPDSGRCTQVILEGHGYPLRHTLSG